MSSCIVRFTVFYCFDATLYLHLVYNLLYCWTKFVFVRFELLMLLNDVHLKIEYIENLRQLETLVSSLIRSAIESFWSYVLIGKRNPIER